MSTYKKEHKARHLRYQKLHPDLNRNRQMKRKYGITLQEYRKMEAEQKGLCMICGLPDKRQMLSVDHCHETKRIRGLLCTACNLALGYFRDSKENLLKAIKYLS